MNHKLYAGCALVTLLSTTAFSLTAVAYNQPDQYNPYTQSTMQYEGEQQPAYGMPQVQQAGNVSYVSGGVGEGSKDAIEAMKGSFNVHILSAAKSGAFIGDTYIVISDSKTQEVLVNTAAGPIFYANLPKGRYVIDASSNGESKQKTITVGGKKSVDVRFMWTDTDTVLTPAE